MKNIRSTKEKICGMMEDAIAGDIFPGAVLLFSKGNDILFHDSFGQSNIFKKQKMKKDIIFDLGSLTKPLSTALCISLLIESKQISLDQKIGSILDDVTDIQKQQITVDMLLRHTSGLPAHREYFKKIDKEDKNTRQQIRDAILKESLEATPGSVQIYSDLGYIILAWVCEKIARERIDRFARQKIYKPLGIKNLFYVDLVHGDVPDGRQNHGIAATEKCPWRSKTLIGEVHDDNAWIAGGIEGHAGLFGDANSVFSLCLEILNALQCKETKVLSSRVIQHFVKKENVNEKTAGFDTPSITGSSSGKFFSEKSIGHLGFTGTSFWIDPETSLIIILLTNRVHPSRSNEKIKRFRPKIHDLIALSVK
jgi:serine-type D-Ala-D-Ala carboxypeptidase